MTERLARACAAHPWRTIAAWIVVVLLAVAAAAFLMGELTTEGHPTNTPESERANDAIGGAFPSDPSTVVTDVIIVRSSRYRAASEPFQTFVRRLAFRVGETRAVASSPSRDQMRTSPDGHALLAPIFITDTDLAGRVVDVVQDADRDPRFAVNVTGDQTMDNDANELSQSDLEHGELRFGLPAAFVVLILVFGALVAGLIPLLIALLSIAVAVGLVALFSQAFELSVFFINMLTGMGLALGIDYSLFVVSRYREERGKGFVREDAIGIAGATACRSVLFSGTAFVVAMFGMLIVPNNIMRSLALGAILVGITSVVAALTLLPALLGVLGDRINAGRIPILGRSSAESRFWHGVVVRVLRRPGISLAVATAVLVALALPVLGLEIGTNGVSTLPDRLASKQGFIALQQSFPDVTTDPAEVVVVRGDGQRVGDGVRRLNRLVAADHRFGRAQARISPDRTVVVLQVPVRGDSASSDAVAAVRHLRSDVIPDVFAGSGATVYVGGDTAENIDYFDSVIDPAPIVLLFVLGLTFVLLTVVFRSVVVAATGIFLNLLSVGAAYGLLVLVFQHGWGAGLLGFQHVDSIEAWVPLFLFSVLFGLSMDYQVFLLSRIKERHDEEPDTRAAVTWGVSSTARIITGAALIIIVVFLGFAMGDMVMFQQMGFGIAVALLLDATVIRSVVLPALMVLLGAKNWYLPAWLNWLPDFRVEKSARAV